MVDKPEWQLVLPGDKIIIVPEDEVVEGQVPLMIQLRGILKALRVILEVPQGESILGHAVILMRRTRFVGAGDVGLLLAEHKLTVMWDSGPVECVINSHDTGQEWRTIKIEHETNLACFMRTLDKVKADIGKRHR